MTKEGMKLTSKIKEELNKNMNTISAKFIDELAKEADKTFFRQKGTTVCILELETGHKCIGTARVFNIKMDNEEIGKEVAERDAKNELWTTIISIAKLFAKD